MPNRSAVSRSNPVGSPARRAQSDTDLARLVRPENPVTQLGQDVRHRAPRAAAGRRASGISGFAGSSPTRGTVADGAAAHVKRMAATSLRGVAGGWVDPDAIRTMIVSVRAAYAAAPGWVQLALPAMLAFAVVVGILRVASSLAGRLAVAAVMRRVCGWYGPEFVVRVGG